MTSAAGNGDRPEKILVGVDGSPSSRAALAWAAREAALTGAPLTAVTTWFYPTSYGYPLGCPEDFNPADDARSILEGSVSEVLGTHPSIAITTEIVEGHPSAVLVEESKTATLVVVGCRGHGEFAGMLLGSVSEFLSTHAHCPVVIMRGGHE
jgi:nucleotide-binding universal stress UspA family protein